MALVIATVVSTHWAYAESSSRQNMGTNKWCPVGQLSNINEDILRRKVLSEEQKPATNPSQIPEKQAKNNNNKGNINYFHWIFRSDRMIVISTQKRT